MLKANDPKSKYLQDPKAVGFAGFGSLWMIHNSYHFYTQVR